MSIKATHKSIASSKSISFYKRSYYRFLPAKVITADGHTVTNEETITEEFNNYFVNVGKPKADAVAPRLACNLNFTAADKNSNLLFLPPNYPEDIFNVIKKLKKLQKKFRRQNCFY